MRAVVYDDFGEEPELREVPAPSPPERGVVVEVQACGLCRSDWHGWRGHDPMITPPHVPGHELAGVVTEIGSSVEEWAVGDRVTVPFVGGCGRCRECGAGHPQVCPNQFQPGFSAWGSFAEYVAIDYADENLVEIPDEVSTVAGSILGCRFGTAFRAVIDQGEVSGGDWVAVFGCGGVGLSAIMVAQAVGAQVVAVDVADEPLEMAADLGAAVTINSGRADDVVDAIHVRCDGGAHVSIDAAGNADVCAQSVSCLRKRGRHVQAGLLVCESSRTAIPFERIIADELEVRGTHGIQSGRYPAIFGMIAAGSLSPGKLVTRTLSLGEAGRALVRMGSRSEAGVQVIDTFE